jgi:hypothetical protein
VRSLRVWLAALFLVVALPGVASAAAGDSHSIDGVQTCQWVEDSPSTSWQRWGQSGWISTPGASTMSLGAVAGAPCNLLPNGQLKVRVAIAQSLIELCYGIDRSFVNVFTTAGTVGIQVRCGPSNSGIMFVRLVGAFSTGYVSVPSFNGVRAHESVDALVLDLSGPQALWLGQPVGSSTANVKFQTDLTGRALLLTGAVNIAGTTLQQPPVECTYTPKSGGTWSAAGSLFTGPGYLKLEGSNCDLTRVFVRQKTVGVGDIVSAAHPSGGYNRLVAGSSSLSGVTPGGVQTVVGAWGLNYLLEWEVSSGKVRSAAPAPAGDTPVWGAWVVVLTPGVGYDVNFAIALFGSSPTGAAMNVSLDLSGSSIATDVDGDGGPGGGGGGTGGGAPCGVTDLTGCLSNLGDSINNKIQAVIDSFRTGFDYLVAELTSLFIPSSAELDEFFVGFDVQTDRAPVSWVKGGAVFVKASSVQFVDWAQCSVCATSILGRSVNVGPGVAGASVPAYMWSAVIAGLWLLLLRGIVSALS